MWAPKFKATILGLRVTQVWSTPSQEVINVNCDASQCRLTKNGGIGVIARNSEGHVIGGATHILKGKDAESLEAEAILLGIKLAIEKGWNQVEI